MDNILKDLKFYAKDMKILIVEDNKEFNAIMVDTMSRFFGVVNSAYNGQEGLDMYREHAYDIVISDINMPIMDGIKFAQKIKNIHNEQSIIMLSAHDDSSHLIKLIEIGVSAFSAKPYVPETFFMILLRECENTLMRQELNRQTYKNLERHILEKTQVQTKHQNEQQDILAHKKLEDKISHILELNSELQNNLDKIYLYGLKHELIEEISIIIRSYYDIFILVETKPEISDRYKAILDLLREIKIEDNEEYLKVKDTLEAILTVNEGYLNIKETIEAILTVIVKFTDDLFSKIKVVNYNHFKKALDVEIEVLSKLLH